MLLSRNIVGELKSHCVWLLMSAMSMLGWRRWRDQRACWDSSGTPERHTMTPRSLAGAPRCSPGEPAFIHSTTITFTARTTIPTPKARTGFPQHWPQKEYFFPAVISLFEQLTLWLLHFFQLKFDCCLFGYIFTVVACRGGSRGMPLSQEV